MSQIYTTMILEGKEFRLKNAKFLLKLILQPIFVISKYYTKTQHIKKTIYDETVYAYGKNLSLHRKFTPGGDCGGV